MSIVDSSNRITTPARDTPITCTDKYSNYSARNVAFMSRFLIPIAQCTTCTLDHMSTIQWKYHVQNFYYVSKAFGTAHSLVCSTSGDDLITRKSTVSISDSHDRVQRANVNQDQNPEVSVCLKVHPVKFAC